MTNDISMLKYDSLTVVDADRMLRELSNNSAKLYCRLFVYNGKASYIATLQYHVLFEAEFTSFIDMIQWANTIVSTVSEMFTNKKEIGDEKCQ